MRTEATNSRIRITVDDLLHIVNTTPASDTVVFSEQTVELYTETEESLISCLAGWLIRKCSICRNCQDCLVKPAAEHSYCRRPIDVFTDKKRFRDTGSTITSSAM